VGFALTPDISHRMAKLKMYLIITNNLLLDAGAWLVGGLKKTI